MQKTLIETSKAFSQGMCMLAYISLGISIFDVTADSLAACRDSQMIQSLAIVESEYVGSEFKTVACPWCWALAGGVNPALGVADFRMRVGAPGGCH
jgi:hypothetical protein